MDEEKQLLEEEGEEDYQVRKITWEQEEKKGKVKE